MLVVYSLKLKSIHFKYLLLGVLTYLDLLKKKEQIGVIGVQTKKKKIKTQKYTVLKSPFINKGSREQFKLQLHSAVIFFSVSPKGSFLESSLLKYAGSQYVEIKILKRYKAQRLFGGMVDAVGPKPITYWFKSSNR